MQIPLSVLSRTHWTWTKVQTKHMKWKKKKGIAKGNERACKTLALGFSITFWRSCINSSETSEKARKCMFLGKQTDNSEHLTVRWKNWTKPLLAYFQRQKCPSSLEDLAARTQVKFGNLDVSRSVFRKLSENNAVLFQGVNIVLKSGFS